MMNWIKKALGAGDAETARVYIEQGSTVIDVRTRAEYSQGHLEGSISIPLNEIGSKIAEIKKMKQPIVTCCRSGARSGTAANMLKDAGIEALNGGSWNGLV